MISEKNMAAGIGGDALGTIKVLSGASRELACKYKPAKTECIAGVFGRCY